MKRLVAIVLLAFAVGCTTAPVVACNTDEQCPLAQFCVDGLCDFPDDIAPVDVVGFGDVPMDVFNDGGPGNDVASGSDAGLLEP